MDPITQQVVLATAGAAGGDKVYVDDVFSTFLYNGTGTNGQTINNGIDLSGEGGLVWCKRRQNSERHCLFDTENGITKTLGSNETTAARTRNWVTSFNSNGWSHNTNDTELNHLSENYVSWSFRKAPGFFDVVTYTGDGNSTKTINHNLGSVPGMIIVKRTSGSGNWITYHRSTGASKWLILNTIDGPQNNYGIWPWNNTTPTSTQFTVALEGTGISSDTYRLNINNETYVAYIFAHDNQSFGTDEDESIIKCGQFTIPGSGTFDVNLGFEPQFILYKQVSGGMGTPNWYMHDTMRGLSDTPFNPLYANLTNGESPQTTTSNLLITYPTGFKSLSSAHNSGNYIYMAIRRPHKPPTAGTDVFDIDLQTSGSKVTTNFVADTAFFAQRASLSEFFVFDRMRGRAYLDFNSNSPAGTYSGTTGVHWDYQDGYDEDNVLNSKMGANVASVYHSFKRAPGFFDTVIYDGNATAGTSHNHNLKAIPEFIICKSFKTGTGGAGFWCYHKDLSTNYAIRLDGSSNGSDAEQSGSNYWNSSTHSATTFTLGNYGDINGSGKTFISYLFATLPGISKVGSYSGTGNAINVDCGFTSGARYILIKRKDAAGDWFVWDTARGIVSGNDPYKLLNTNAAEVTSTDYIDPLNSGFTVTSSAPAALNTSGGTYIFLAIA